MRFFSLILCLLCSFIVSASLSTARFERLTIENGLSQNSVESIIHDKRGFIWFATHDGLNRYDGYQFKYFRHDPQDETTLSNSFVTVIFEDSRGELWIGTKGGGLNRYDAQNQKFVRFTQDDQDSNSLSHNYVTSITEDNHGVLWIGTFGGGLNRYDPLTDEFRRFVHIEGDNNSLSHNQVRFVLQDSLGWLWVATEGGGLNRMNIETSRFVHFRHDPSSAQSLSSDKVYALFEDKNSQLWVGTYGGGLNRFNVRSQTFTVYQHDFNDNNSLSNDYIWDITQDEEGKLWIGTDGGGISMFDIKLQRFDHYQQQLSDPYSLSDNAIRSVYRDTHGLMWIGTLLGGINKVNVKQRYFGHIKRQADDSQSLSHNAVMALYEDYSGELWVGTWGKGLNHKGPTDTGFEHFRYDSKNPRSLSDDSVWSVKGDSKGQIWIGTKGGLNRYNSETNDFDRFVHQPSNAQSLSFNWIMDILEDSRGLLWLATRGGGLNRFDEANNRFVHYRQGDDRATSISSDLTMAIAEDIRGRLWIGTWGGGVNLFDPESEKFVVFRHDDDIPTSISDDYVMSIYRDSNGVLWLGTFGGGLNKYDEKTNSFIHYREKDGLANDTVYAILEDTENNLWLSTNRGLSKFNPKTLQFRSYNVRDGLQSNEFNGGAQFRSRSGELFFGGINGFNRFYPHKIRDNKSPPDIVFTDFLLFNRSVVIDPTHENSNIGDKFTLSRAIDQLSHIDIGYRQNLVTFEFAALDYSNPLKNEYRYRLDGLDDKWIIADAKIRRATYTNIPYGRYVLHVQASNADGYWNRQGAQISINVMRPPWLSWWAYLIYFIFTALIVVKFIYYRIERSKVRNERMMLHHLKQVDKLKDDFLANTSHELRTPLNGIIGLAESMIDGIDGQLPEKAKKTLTMIVTSGRRLASLINDILDLSKLKHSGIELQCQAIDLQALTDVVLTLSKPLVGNKALDLVNDVPAKLQAVEADENRLLQILHNLVGNGIKFTDAGCVRVNAVAEDEFIKISVSDTGVGISEDQFEAVFESFEQAQGDLDRSYGGTGLGLTITKQLVELHGGSIGLDSKLGSGSTFWFTIPKCSKKAAQAIHSKTDQIETSLVEQLDENLDSAAVLSGKACESEGSKFRLLLVDDEPINIHVLKNYLSKKHYQMVEARDGIQALELIENNGPFDMVLLDIMMPRMSGYEVCRKIRETYSVSDLPVIFLTASNQVDDVVQGFNVGANDHLHKPVAKHELLSRVGTHLRLLDINRNLENRVIERTAQVELQNERLEQKNKKILAAQEKLILSEKLASLGALMAGVAHEINNPTNFVVFSIDNLKNDLAACRSFIFELAGDDAPEEILDGFRGKFDPLDEHIKIIKDGTQRIQTIIKDLQTSTRMGDIEKISVNITDTLMSTINLISAEYKQQVEIVTDLAAVPEVNCHPSKLSQVFMNLIVNACDAVRERKRDEMRHDPNAFDNSEPGEIIIGCKAVVDFIEITVRDNGCGMTEQTKERLFEAFYTTKGIEEGTGLGLSISRDIVRQHGGDLTVESQQGMGSEFKLTLPI